MAALPRLGDTHGYVLSQVDAPDERWVYDYRQTHEAPWKTRPSDRACTSCTTSGYDSTGSSHSVGVCVVQTHPESI